MDQKTFNVGALEPVATMLLCAGEHPAHLTIDATSSVRVLALAVGVLGAQRAAATDLESELAAELVAQGDVPKAAVRPPTMHVHASGRVVGAGSQQFGGAAKEVSARSSIARPALEPVAHRATVQASGRVIGAGVTMRSAGPQLLKEDVAVAVAVEANGAEVLELIEAKVQADTLGTHFDLELPKLSAEGVAFVRLTVESATRKVTMLRMRSFAAKE